MWCADFKGDFKTGDRKRCYPLTLTDAFSRMLLRCTALRSTKTVRARPIFEAVFREFGLPERIRTDNRTPFASRGAGVLSALSVWWIKLGHSSRAHPTRSPGAKRTARADAPHAEAGDAAPTGGDDAEARFDSFLVEYNHDRPHEAIENATPSTRYAPSPRSYPSRLPTLHYPANFLTRKVAASGRIRWKSAMVTIGHALEGESIGIEPGDGLHHVFFSDVRLGFLDETSSLSDLRSRVGRE